MRKDCFQNAYILNLEGKYREQRNISVLIIVKYLFVFFSASAGGFDLSLFNMHTIEHLNDITIDRFDIVISAY